MPRYKLVVFDVNGVLTPEHTVVELAGLVGPDDATRQRNHEKIKKIIEKHTTGREELAVTFNSLAGTFKGLVLDDMADHALHLPLMPGIMDMVYHLLRNNVRLAIITTGFDVTIWGLNRQIFEVVSKRMSRKYLPAARRPAPAIFNPALCNLLRFEQDGRELEPPQVLEKVASFKEPLDTIVSNGKIDLLVPRNESKGDLIAALAGELGIQLKHIAAVGDSMGDKDMIERVVKGGGLGIAFNANRQLQRFAHTLNQKARQDLYTKLSKMRGEKLRLRDLPDRAVVVKTPDLRLILPFLLNKDQLHERSKHTKPPRF